MLNSVMPVELYEAARETCLRLYVANGGNKSDEWRITTIGGTAAIAFDYDYGSRRRTWTLCMPALPLDVRVPRWQADLIAGYTVHELLHSLWTDWPIVAQAKREGLGMLHNAIEDTRIEGRASKGGLRMVSEARHLLVLLNQHVFDKAKANPSFSFKDERQFSFLLTLVIFHERLGYASDFPKNWRKLVEPRMLPLFDLALSRYDGLKDSADALQLARDLTNLAKSLPAPATPEADKDNAGEDAGEASEGAKGAKGAKGEDTEGEDTEGDDSAAGEASEASESDEDEGDAGKGAGAGEDEGEGAEGDADAGEASEGAEDGKGDTGKGEGAPETDSAAGEASEGAGDAGEGEGDKGDAGEDADAGEGAKGEGGNAGAGQGAGVNVDAADPVDLNDGGQDYREVSLADLSDEGAERDAHNAMVSVNAAKPRVETSMMRDDPGVAAALVSTPARLRRHVTLAVKAPERVGFDRFQVSGRLDMRNLAGIGAKRDNVYRRRVEDDGREAVVTLLVDVSSSMSVCGRMAAARALALHMGDALKAAGVRFEVATFKDVRGCCMNLPKPLAKPWTADARAAVAGMMPQGGTQMLPAIKDCAARLLDVRNVSRRIMLVLTDGEDHFPTQANAIQAKSWRRRGVEILGIGLGLDDSGAIANIREAFDGRVVFVNDPAQLSVAGLSALVAMLDKDAPRTGA